MILNQYLYEEGMYSEKSVLSDGYSSLNKIIVQETR